MTWHVSPSEDLEVRRSMISQIAVMLGRIAGAPQPTTHEMDQARRLEVQLYKASKTKEEYSSVRSLRSRIAELQREQASADAATAAAGSATAPAAEGSAAPTPSSSAAPTAAPSAAPNAAVLASAASAPNQSSASQPARDGGQSTSASGGAAGPQAPQQPTSVRAAGSKAAKPSELGNVNAVGAALVGATSVPAAVPTPPPQAPVAASAPPA